MGLSSLPARSPFVPLLLFERQLVQSHFVSPLAVTGGSARQRCAHSARQSFERLVIISGVFLHARATIASVLSLRLIHQAWLRNTASKSTSMCEPPLTPFSSFFFLFFHFFLVVFF
jgi:hypothetical protein